LFHFLNRLRKKSEQQIPRGLKAAWDDKNKRLIGPTEVVPHYKAFKADFFRSPWSRALIQGTDEMATISPRVFDKLFEVAAAEWVANVV
jgi:hypothetical protein